MSIYNIYRPNMIYICPNIYHMPKYGHNFMFYLQAFNGLVFMALCSALLHNFYFITENNKHFAYVIFKYKKDVLNVIQSNIYKF